MDKTKGAKKKTIYAVDQGVRGSDKPATEYFATKKEADDYCREHDYTNPLRKMQVEEQKAEKLTAKQTLYAVTWREADIEYSTCSYFATEKEAKEFYENQRYADPPESVRLDAWTAQKRLTQTQKELAMLEEQSVYAVYDTKERYPWAYYFETEEEAEEFYENHEYMYPPTKVEIEAWLKSEMVGKTRLDLQAEAESEEE